MSELKRRDKFLCLNSMVCLLKALEGKCTTIDLRNECYVTGEITNVGPFMGIELEKVLFYDSQGSVYAFETFFIKPRNIRYVHIPKNLNPIKLMENVIEESNRKYVNPSDKHRTFKTKRANTYQKEILISLGTS